MAILKPKPLRRGDVIGIAAPASPPASEDELGKGIRYLESLGYRIELGPHLYHRRGYLAGTDEQRTSDLHKLFENRKVKAIFTVRGGYGALRILPYLNFNIFRRNPKILLGYSDITALQLALFSKIGLISFSGPMVSVEMAEGLKGHAEEQLWDCLTSTRPPGEIKIKPRERTIYEKGNASGRVLGGNLTMIAALVGSRFLPREEGHLLLLEEIDEKPYRIDRILAQMKRTKFLNAAGGVVLGKFIGCEPSPGKPSLSLGQIFQDVFQPYEIPVMGHIQYGHVKNPLTIPIGVKARINTAEGTVEFLEGGVG
ncbi:MAG: LD-carboxypeptidase [Bacteroidota bacterium]